jgi:hypothetical protein
MTWRTTKPSRSAGSTRRESAPTRASCGEACDLVAGLEACAHGHSHNGQRAEGVKGSAEHLVPTFRRQASVEALLGLVTSAGRKRESRQGGCGEHQVLPALERGSHPITSLLSVERVSATTPCPHIGLPVRTPIGRYRNLSTTNGSLGDGAGQDRPCAGSRASWRSDHCCFVTGEASLLRELSFAFKLTHYRPSSMG